MAFDLEISPGAGLPIFRQIVERVRLAVVTGDLCEGDQLPTVRGLAERLLINPNTVAKAYGELTRQGIIESQQGRGLFVAKPRQIYTKAERLRRIAPLIDAFAHEGLWLGFTAEELIELVKEKLQRLTVPEPTRRKPA